MSSLCFFICSFSFSVGIDLDSNIRDFFQQQNRIISFNIQFIEKPPKNIDQIEYPGSYSSGINKLKLIGEDGRKRKIKFRLEIKELIPVVSKSIQSGETVSSNKIGIAWIDESKIKKFVIKNKNDILGNVSKYSKKRGALFYKYDLRKQIVINNQDPCNIIVNYNEVSIVMPGIALKNGFKGSKIRVLNTSTKKILDAIVLDSRNVEVILN